MSRLPLILWTAVILTAAAPAPAAAPASMRTVVDQFCVNCHDADAAKGDLDLTAVASDDFGRHPEVWEKVVRRLRGRQMPPAGKPRLAEDVYVAAESELEIALDR